MDMVLLASILVVLRPCMELHHRVSHFDPGTYPTAGRYVSLLCGTCSGAHVDCRCYRFAGCSQNPTAANLAPTFCKTRGGSTAASLVGKNRRSIYLTSLFLCIVLFSGAGAVVYCLSIRQYYTSLIRKALAGARAKG